MLGRKNKSKKVFVGLSGGVDSAVSAALLQQEGYDVTGVFIRIVVPGYPCSAGEDKISAMRVAAHLRVPFIEIDLSKEYQQEVFAASVSEYARGHTPNPDTLCNQKIKFGKFYEFAKSKDADFIATGHYARLTAAKENKIHRVHDFSAEKSLSPQAVALRSPYESYSPWLLAGADKDKDQSYFLWMVPEEVLRHTLFPVGDKKKSEVRVLAKKFNLPNAERKDSQGLCFLGPVSIEEMISQELKPLPGKVITSQGIVVGTHKGVALYTLGQRHGFEVLAKEARTQPHFVIAKNIEANTLTVATSPFPTGATCTIVTLKESNWIGPYTQGELYARFRYRQKLIPAQLSPDKVKVTLTEPYYVPLGQSLVLYLPAQAGFGERCIGGGIIEDSIVC